MPVHGLGPLEVLPNRGTAAHAHRMEPTLDPSQPPAPGPHNWDDFLALAEDDPRELIDGRLTEAAVPTALHEYIVMTLGIFVGSWARARRAGITPGSGFKVQINRKSGVQIRGQGDLGHRCGATHLL